MKPSLSQYINACANETGSGVKSVVSVLFLFVASIRSLLIGIKPKILEQTLDAMRLEAGRLLNPQCVNVSFILYLLQEDMSLLTDKR